MVRYPLNKKLNGYEPPLRAQCQDTGESHQLLKDFKVQGDSHMHNDKGTHSMINTWGKSCGHRDNGEIDLVDGEVTWSHGRLQR